MEKDEKGAAAAFTSAPDMEICADGQSVAVQSEELKRDLNARHINMIAIAGMIVGDRLRTSEEILLTRSI